MRISCYNDMALVGLMRQGRIPMLRYASNRFARQAVSQRSARSGR